MLVPWPRQFRLLVLPIGGHPLNRHCQIRQFERNDRFSENNQSLIGQKLSLRSRESWKNSCRSYHMALVRKRRSNNLFHALSKRGLCHSAHGFGEKATGISCRANLGVRESAASRMDNREGGMQRRQCQGDCRVHRSISAIAAVGSARRTSIAPSRLCIPSAAAFSSSALRQAVMRPARRHRTRGWRGRFLLAHGSAPWARRAAAAPARSTASAS